MPPSLVAARETQALPLLWVPTQEPNSEQARSVYLDPPLAVSLGFLPPQPVSRPFSTSSSSHCVPESTTSVGSPVSDQEVGGIPLESS